MINIDELPLTDAMISDYLQDNPDFFNRNANLLSSLRINNNQRGVVSLVERQQQNLRDKMHLLEDEITQLLSIANANEQLFTVYSELYLQLIDANSINELLDCLHQTTTKLLLLADCKIWFVNPIKSDHPAIIKEDCQHILSNRLTDENYYFGRMQKNEIALLFHNNEIFSTSATGSAALIKLNVNNNTIGFIAISSLNADHFDPHMNTLLLNQFRQLVAKLISKHL